MKAISIQQPWAWLIVNGYKDVENRTWATKHRGRVLIHAPKTVDKTAFQAQREWVQASGIQIPDDLPTGAIVGEATITGTVKTSASPWFAGPVAIELAAAVAYAEPIPARGQLGVYECQMAQIEGGN